MGSLYKRNTVKIVFHQCCIFDMLVQSVTWMESMISHNMTPPALVAHCHDIKYQFLNKWCQLDFSTINTQLHLELQCKLLTCMDKFSFAKNCEGYILLKGAVRHFHDRKFCNFYLIHENPAILDHGNQEITISLGTLVPNSRD